MIVDKSHNVDITRRRKKSRLETRINVEEKDLLKRAAELQGCSLTARDSEAFVKALLKPSAPSKKIKACGSALQENYASPFLVLAATI